MPSTDCRVCGEVLEQPATGRPKAYCGEECRRFAENERRRLGALIAHIDKRLIEERINVALYGDHRNHVAHTRVQVLEDERAKALDRQYHFLGLSPQDSKS
jgi:predicted nucleic acid-binding Zn ribbon protein